MTAGQVYVRVYWEDTDAGGVVYHASYLRFMERGRTELLRERGIHQGELLDDRGVVFVVARMEIDFRRPGKIDDELTVETVIDKIGRGSIHLTQKVARGTELLAEAKVVCAVISRGSGKATRISADVRGKLAPEHTSNA